MDVDRHPQRRPHRPADATPARRGPVVVPIRSEADLVLVLAGGAEAERRGTALELVHAVRPAWSPVITGRAGPPPARGPRGHDDEIAALRARALTLARLSAVTVTWTTALGRADDVLERICRDRSATLLVVGADRKQLTTRRLRSTLAGARRLARRAATPVHLICRG